MNSNKNSSIKKRSSARRAAMQALYTWTISKSELADISQHYLLERNPENLNIAYFKTLLNGVSVNKNLLDEAIIKYSDRKQLDPIELCILRVASYELMFNQELPFKIIISEALELANMFGSESSYKFINSILDRLAKEYRKI